MSELVNLIREDRDESPHDLRFRQQQRPVECTACRVCGSADLTPLFSLGTQMVSDFVEKERVHDGIRCPIELVLCPKCGAVQQKWTAPQDFLYTRFYWYRSSVTQSMRDALADITAAAERLVELKSGDVVLDIGSNDSTLLRSYTVPDIVRVGVEPATNLAEEGRKGADVFINDFWSADAYRKAMWQVSPEKAPRSSNDAKLVTALGMMYDLDDINSFVGDIAKVLRDDGIFIAQLMCLKNMLALNDVGNLTHEHLTLFSLRSLDHLFAAHGLEIFDIETNQVNGESYRLYVRKVKNTLPPRPAGARQRLEEARALEVAMELDRPETYRAWLARLEENRDRCVSFIKEQVSDGKRVYVYGASTKGNVLLQWMGLDSTLIEAAAERSPEKVGKFTVGTGIKIVDEDEFRRANPDFALALPYSFIAEFLAREREWLEGGGRFIVPLPQAHTIGADQNDLANRARWTTPDRLPLWEINAL